MIVPATLASCSASRHTIADGEPAVAGGGGSMEVAIGSRARDWGMPA